MQSGNLELKGNEEWITIGNFDEITPSGFDCRQVREVTYKNPDLYVIQIPKGF